MKTLQQFLALTASAALTLGLAACSSSGSGDGGEKPADSGNNSGAEKAPNPEPTDSTTSEASTSCSDIWVDGKILPKGYEECENGDTTELAVRIECKDGSEFTTYDDKFYAVVGGTIHANVGTPADDPAYVAAYDACHG